MGIKILVLALVWIAVGIVMYVAELTKVFVRIWKLDEERCEDLIDEVLEVATCGMIRVRGESQESIKNQVEGITGKPHILAILYDFATWPTSLPSVMRQISEAMNHIEAEYTSGIRTRKEKEAS